jgi:hypothetical protein
LVAATLLILTVLVPAAGCGSSIVDQDTTPPTGLETIVTAYMPYVENVTIPEPIYAGEDFTLTMRVSSVLEPWLLNGDVRRRLYIVGPGINPARPRVLEFPMWMGDREVVPPGPAPDTAEFEYPAYMPLRLPAGEWYIGVQTAKTRELGGVCVTTDNNNLADWDEHYADPETGRTNFVEYRLYPITVVERPSA